jgi:glycerol-3-phosphate acyltransferase PlsY
MSGRVGELAACAIGYGLGSVPTGVIVSRLARGVDVRDYGSGGMGTTNVLRTVGPVAAGSVFVLDVAKGTTAVLAARVLRASPAGQAAAGVAAVAGHSWPVWARFRGGKSVATGFGALLALSPPGSAAAVVGGLSALAATRIVSVGSLAAALSATAGTGVDALRRGGRGPWPFAYAATTTAVIAVRHSANLRRIVKGVEPRLSFRRSGAKPVTAAAAV